MNIVLVLFLLALNIFAFLFFTLNHVLPALKLISQNPLFQED